jgi:hypothetical protein
MGLFGFFGKNRRRHKNAIIAENPSTEQTAFAESVLSIMTQTMLEKGFERDKAEIKTYSTTIVFRKGKRYVKISSTSYPTDYPYCYFLVLGEGDSDNFFEYDWNSVSIAGLAKIIDPHKKIHSYNFPVGDPAFDKTIKFSVENANQDLLKYGASFLEGDLSIFYQARKDVNNQREPYKISVQDQNGVRKTTYEPISMKQKKKYS